MNCKEVEERDILEGYLLDRLTEPEREEFETHYFECASCLSQLQTRLAVQTELQRQPVMPVRARGASFRLRWAWTPAFVTVALLLAAGIWRYSAQKQHSSQSQQVSLSPPKASPEVSVPTPPPAPMAPSLEELARVEPPPYSEIVLRGSEDEGQETFRSAMLNFSKKDYAQAIPGLRAAVKASPQNPSFSFYLGACYLLTGRTDPAIISFRKTISLGNPAYSESAHFYLAKAYLKKKEVSAAREELREAVRLHGNRESEAGEILRQLGK